MSLKKEVNFKCDSEGYLILKFKKISKDFVSQTGNDITYKDNLMIEPRSVDKKKIFDTFKKELENIKDSDSF